MKKSIAVLLSVIMVFCPLASTVSAADITGEISDLPLVMVAGYSSPELVMTDENGEQTQVWGLNMDSIIGRVMGRIADLGKGLILTVEGNPEYLGRVVGEELEAELEYLKLNPDGTSKYNVTVANPDTMEKNMKYILENNLPEEYINERNIIDKLAGKYVDTEYIYSFASDWRMSIVDCAKDLDKLIEDIKEITGKDKVNIIAVSHGGQITATYLSLYGYKKNVNNAVLTVPAIGGAVLAYDVMNDGYLDEYTLVYYLEHGFIAEGQYEWLVEAKQLGFLDDIVKELLPYARNVVGYWGSIWDFIPNEDYEQTKARRLDPVENARIIEKSDYAHELMANMHESLQRCRDEYGIDISIIAGSGVPAVSSAQRNSDAIISTNDSTGALCAPYGKRFNDGYTGTGTQCDDVTHDHVSPSMEIDATYAYLPENTWFVDELFHGMTFKDDYSETLAFTLLFTENISDVHSDSRYPQFHESTNANNGVFLRFDKSLVGYISDADSYIIVKNISNKYPIKLTSLLVEGAGIKIHYLGLKAIEPGEEVKIEFTGSLPKVSNALMQVKASYQMEGNTTALIGDKLFNFKIMNGPSVSYDEENPYVDSDYTFGYGDYISDETGEILTNLGLSAFVRHIFEMILSLMSEFGFDVFLK